MKKTRRDLIACHRLGRQVARGGTLIEELVGIAIDQIATNADLAYLEAAGLPSVKILERLKDLQALPAMPSIADKIDITERYTYLQLIQSFRQNGGKSNGLFGEPEEKLTPEELKVLSMIDWDLATENAKEWYDRAVVSGLRITKDRSARQKELDKIEKELEAALKHTRRSQWNACPNLAARRRF